MAATAALALALAVPAIADTSVRLYEDGFSPAQVTVDAGETIHFESRTSGAWSVTSDDGLFDSGRLAGSATYAMSMSRPGTHVFRSTGAGAHAGRITVRARSLGGKPGDIARVRIPAIPFPAVVAGDIDTHPSFGVRASRSRILLGFDDDATVEEANDALESADVRIIGGLPSMELLLVETRDTYWWWSSFTTLDMALAKLRGAAGVRFAAMSTLTGPSAVPPRPEQATADRWDWTNPLDAGNRGLAAARFPMAWNILEEVRRKNPTVITGVVDMGFEAHPDLPGLEIQEQVCPPGDGDCREVGNNADDHGNHVAGIIGAAYDNKAGDEEGATVGVSGGNPVARMYGYSIASFNGASDGVVGVDGASLVDKHLELYDLILRSRPADLRVINQSLGAAKFDGATWHANFGRRLCGPGVADDDLPEFQHPMKQVCTPNNLDAWQREMANVGMAAAPVLREASRQGVLIVQAAGNEGMLLCPPDPVCPDGVRGLPIDAAARGEFAWASRHWDDSRVAGHGLANPVLVVQNASHAGDTAIDATLGGDIAGPGWGGHEAGRVGVLSTVTGEQYGFLAGSSMAAPYVSALAGYLLADDPSLSLAGLRKRILDWARPAPASGALDFTWSMPDRMNRDVDGDRLVDYPERRSEFDPSTFTVELDACDATVGARPAATYAWTVDGVPLPATSECATRWYAPAEGSYAVTLTVIAEGGAQQSVTKQVEVEDLLILSVGDSIASGEGNPDEVDPATRWQLERCHRSAFAGPAQAARWLEAADARTSVTFVHLACSGARMEGDRDDLGLLRWGFEGIGGLLTPYEGVTEDDEDSPCALARRMDESLCQPPQLDEAESLVGSRTPDALLVSIGANDMWFSKILKNCMIPFNDCSTNEGGRDLFEERIQLLPERYARVAERIRRNFPDLPSDRVVITQYPDVTTDETGEPNMDCPGAGAGISDEEQTWAHETVIPRLNAQVAQAAAVHGWTVAEGIPAAFIGHGYCSSDPWIVDITDSWADQGNKEGSFHPNYAGHSAYARAIVTSARSVLGLTTLRARRELRDRAPRLDAYRPVAANGTATRIADVNDSSKDGNRRVERRIATDGTTVETLDKTFSRVQGEFTAPDGRVDMRDLRRFRDAWLQGCLADPAGCPAEHEIALDGGIEHVKRDLNFDGCTFGDGCGVKDHLHSRFDFNGDGFIEPIAMKDFMPFTEDGSPVTDRAQATAMTDLDVLEAAWTGGSGAEGWKKDDLPRLLRSGDLEVHADAILEAGASKAVVQVRKKDGPAVGPERTIRRRDGFAIMTVPVEDPGTELELVATATTTKGAMSSVSEPFTLDYGEDRLVAVCPDLSVKASPQRVPGDGRSTSVVTATLHRCQGREEVAGKEVTFTVEPSGADGASLQALAPRTNAGGAAQALFTAGTRPATYVVKVSVAAQEGEDPLEAELEIEVVDTVTVRYVWRQTIEEWNEAGTTRWQASNPLMPDCTGASVEYCIDSFRVQLQHQTLGGIQRAGTLVGGGDRFRLTEQVSNSRAGSTSTWALSFPDGQREDGGKEAEWWVTDPEAYTEHDLTGVRAEHEAGALRLSGMQAVGDLPYHYALLGRMTGGSVDPIEGHAASSGYLLIPQGPSRRIRFAAQPDEDLVFPRREDGTFKPFQSCGALDEDLTSQPGYYVAEASDYIPGATSVRRKTTYAPGDRPMPVGPGRLRVTYAFAAVAVPAGATVPDPVLPDCTVDNPPDAHFTFDPAGDGPAKEGRQVAFQDASTDPENDIVSRTWNFGDGGAGSGVAPHHMFGDDGRYTVTLTVTDAKGNRDTHSEEVVVVNEPPEAEIDEVTARPDELELRYRMLDPGTADKKELRWELRSSNRAFPAAQGTDHAGVWTRGPYRGLPAGTYPITLIVRDKDGAQARDEAVVVVTDSPQPAPPAPAAGTYATCDTAVSLDSEEREFLDLVNDYRADNGVAPVNASATLTRAADRHADDMAANDFMAHTGSDASSPADRAWSLGYPKSAGVGENLAESERASDALWAWRGSSTGHNENMLNPSWRAIGIARKKGAGPWRWATSYGTLQDCPAVSPERTGDEQGLTGADAGERDGTADGQPLEPTPTRAGVESYGAEPPPVRDTQSDGGEVQSDDTGHEPPPAMVGAAQADAETQEDGEPLYGPTAAAAFPEASALGGVPFDVVNRSRDGDGTPIAARVAPGDGSAAKDVAADATVQHSYPDSPWWEYYDLGLAATDAAGRSASLTHEIETYVKRPAWLFVHSTSQFAVAGKPFEVVVYAYDDNTGDILPGLKVIFTLGDQVVQVVADDAGVAKATLTLPDTEGWHDIEISSEATARQKPGAARRRIEIMANHPPVARAGGPYLAGEGGSLLLNGMKSTDEDPSWFDRIVSYEWDLDADGEFDDAAGRLPAIIEGDDLTQRVCAGTCVAGQQYPISLQVTDSHGGQSTDTTHVRFVADFDLLLGSEAKTIVPGQSNSFAVTVIGSRSYAKPVTLEAIDLPAGVTATFSENPITPTGVSVLTLTGSNDLETGTFPIRVRATDGEITKEIGEEVKVAFGLVPICRGQITGVITDRTTGEPMADVHVTTSGLGAVTDSSGRYLLENVPLGWNNAPSTYTVNAHKGGFWDSTAVAQATCGGLPRADVSLLDIRQGTVKGKVIDKDTRTPLVGASIGQPSCSWWGCSYPPVATTDAEGLFSVKANLGPQNTPNQWVGRADAPGYWPEGRYVPFSATQDGNAQFELVKKCSATLKDGVVVYQDTNEPAPGAGVGIYINSHYRPDLVLRADENGRFTVNRTVSLGHNNSAVDFRAVPTVPPGAPEGTVAYEGQFRVTACDQQATTTLYLKTPRPNYGAIEGTVTDEETGLPVADVWVERCYQCPQVKTDAQGKYRFDRVLLGHDSQTGSWQSVSVAPAGFYGANAAKFVTAGSTATMNLKVLKKRFGALTVKVVDSVTGAPIPGAQVYEGWSCQNLCLYTDRQGEGTRAGLELGHRNTPYARGLTATAGGYWPQAKQVTITAGNTSTVEFRLQPECAPARIVGTVVNAETQAPIHGAQVSGGGWPVHTDAEGRFEIADIRPGTGNNPRQVWLNASAEGFYSQSKQVTIFCGARITVEFGSRTTRTGTIVGTVTDGDTGEPLAGAFIGSNFGGTTTTNASGEYRLENAPLGDLNSDREWSVLAAPAGYKSRALPVTVKAGQEVRRDFAFTAANEVPAAQGQELELDEDTSKRLTVAGTDPDGDALTYHVMKWPQHGRLVGRLPDVTYEPDHNYNGPDSFEYVVNDSVVSSERATVRLAVQPVNDAPGAQYDRLESNPDETLRIPVADLLGNDSDPDGDRLRITAVRANHQQATATLDGDHVVFTPPAGWASDVQYAFLDYTIADPAGMTSTAWVYIRVNHGPAAPVCVDRAYTVAPGETLERALGCTDRNGDALTYSLVTPPADGALDLRPGGTFTYTPADGVLGPRAFVFKAGDGALESANATVRITVKPPNRDPECSDVEAEGAEDEPLELTLPCSDADDDPLTVELLTQPGGGQLERVSGRRYRFTPPQDWSGQETATFRSLDAEGESAPATARLRIVPRNDRPVCRDVTLGTLADVPGEAEPACTDVDGDPLTPEIAGQGAKGTASVAGGRLRYQPSEGQSGDDAFTYVARDGESVSEPARATVTLAPGNRRPGLRDDLATTSEDAAVEIPLSHLLANDSDAEGDPFAITAVSGSEHGAVALGDGTVTFTPGADFHGTGRFAYTVADHLGRTVSASVAVAVQPVNDAPVASPDEVATERDRPVAIDAATLLANDRDADGDALTVTGVATPVNGAVALVGGRATFTPASGFSGIGSFAYTAADGHGGTAAGTVFVHVGAVTAADVILGCARRPFVLERVVPAGRRVEIVGIAGLGYAGRTLDIVFAPGDKTVARATVGADGRFTATAPMPARRLRGLATTRYYATDGKDRSRSLKLMRRVQIDGVTTDGAAAVISGRINGPLAARRARRIVEVRHEACTTGEIVARARPDAKGRFRATVTLPPGATAGVFRLRATVRNADGSRRHQRTFSMPLIVGPPLGVVGAG